MKVVVVGCGFPQLSLIRRARALGLEVLGVDANPRAVGVAECNDFFEISTTEEEDIVALMRKTRCKAITTTGSERALTTVAAVAEDLDLPFYADVATVRRAQEKDAMRDAYRRAGIAVPAFVSTNDVVRARKFADEVGYPIVVKPTHGWGQRGVAKVEQAASLSADFADALASTRSAGGSEVVVEGFLRGGEYSGERVDRERFARVVLRDRARARAGEQAARGHARRGVRIRALPRMTKRSWWRKRGAGRRRSG